MSLSLYVRPGWYHKVAVEFLLSHGIATWENLFWSFQATAHVDRKSVEELLPSMAIDAPIGRVVVEMRRFVRLAGEEVERVLRRVSVCGLLDTGSLVGSLTAWMLLHRQSKLVASDFLRSCLKMSSMSSTLGG